MTTERTSISRYRLDREIGRGTTGIVYSAHDPQLSRAVAVKVLHAGADADRLRSEAKALAKLSHPNVVRVYDVGEDAGSMFIAMELVDGESLTTWLQTPRSRQAILDVLVRAARGLAAAHAAGLVHRNFTANAVLISKAGDVLVRDFGAADGDLLASADQRAFRAVALAALEGHKLPTHIGTALRREHTSLAALLEELAPSRKRLAWIAAVLVALCIAPLAIFMLRSPEEKSSGCIVGSTMIDIAWNASTAQQITTRFDATVAADLDRYARAWKSESIGACRAASRGATTASKRRSACVESARKQLVTLLDAMLLASLDQPAYAAGVLPDPGACAKLTADTPASTAATLALEADVLRAELTFAAKTAGVKPVVVDALIERAVQLGAISLELRARIVRGLVAEFAGKIDEALGFLRDAHARAERAGDDRSRALVGAQLGRVLGQSSVEATTEAKQVIAEARAALTRSGGDLVVEKAIEEALVQCALTTQDHPTAVKHQQRVLELVRARETSTRRELADVYHYLATYHSYARQTDEWAVANTTARTIEQQLAREQGNKLLELLAIEDPTGLLHNGFVEEAVASARRVLGVLETHPSPLIDQVEMHLQVGNGLEAMEQSAECLAAYRRADEMLARPLSAFEFEGKPANANYVLDRKVEASFGIGGCLGQLGKRTEEIAELRRAFTFAKELGAQLKGSQHTASVSRFLGVALVRAGQHREARVLLEPLLAEGKRPSHKLPLARLLAALAEALWRSGDAEDRKRALALAADAEAALASPELANEKGFYARTMPKKIAAIRTELAAWMPRT